MAVIFLALRTRIHWIAGPEFAPQPVLASANSFQRQRSQPKKAPGFSIQCVNFGWNVVNSSC